MRRIWDRLLDRECRCGYLERAAREPHCPIKHEEQSNRFCVKYDGQNRTKLLFHHCPGCGGRLRASSVVRSSRLRIAIAPKPKLCPQEV